MLPSQEAGFQYVKLIPISVLWKYPRVVNWGQRQKHAVLSKELGRTGKFTQTQARWEDVCGTTEVYSFNLCNDPNSVIGSHLKLAPFWSNNTVWRHVLERLWEWYKGSTTFTMYKDEIFKACQVSISPTSNIVLTPPLGAAEVPEDHLHHH